jgi:hypothetical protein
LGVWHWEQRIVPGAWHSRQVVGLWPVVRLGSSLADAVVVKLATISNVPREGATGARGSSSPSAARACLVTLWPESEWHFTQASLAVCRRWSKPDAVLGRDR